MTEKAWTPRRWGIWTEAKLGILASYLPRFLRASSKLPEKIYIDAFAGQGKGTSRSTKEEFPGSAEIAAKADAGNGGFTRLRYFEVESKAKQLEDLLRTQFPGRDIKVYAGDCNAQIPKALDDLAHLNWAPTFAFLDPDGMELRWETLQALADFKAPRKDGTRNKVELWMLFPTPGLMRTLALDSTKVTQEDKNRASRLFGCEDWTSIYESRRRNEISPAQARDLYLNLIRWRLENDLGYTVTHSFEIKNTTGTPLYHMIFATDNAAGDTIMKYIYESAAKAFPGMLAEAKNDQMGQVTFDLGSDYYVVPTYTHEPPQNPTESLDGLASGPQGPN